MEILSSAFHDGEAIPEQYSYDGRNTSPPLELRDVPENAESLALVVEDPDAPNGTFCHWVLYNVPPRTTRIAAGVAPDETLGDGSRQGVNDFGAVGYGGPRPPSGTHRYYFRLYALDTMPDLDNPVKRQDLQGATEGHVLAEAQLMGTYSKTQARGAD
jgi:Raf kinase inhibitor-like YbhB/YbcL family protein